MQRYTLQLLNIKARRKGKDFRGWHKRKKLGKYFLPVSAEKQTLSILT